MQAKWAVDNLKAEYLMSKHIKGKFDEKYGSNWHCVVGKNFNSFVSYEAKNYIFFYEGQLAILLYKIG
jgi:dynein light chain LC8-type